MIRDASQFGELVDEVQRLIEKVSNKADPSAVSELEGKFYDLFPFMVVYSDADGRDLKKLVELLQSSTQYLLIDSPGYETLFLYSKGTESDLTKDLRTLLSLGSELLKKS